MNNLSRLLDINQSLVSRWWILLYVFVWVVARFISDSNLDPAGDMLENFAWGQEFSWGQSKHPPLIGWITGLWFWVFPNNDFFYFVLAYTSAALGLFGVYRFARAIGLKQQALPAVLLLSVALPYSTLAVKFNANTVLLLTWPWLAWAWVNAIRRPSIITAILFGLLSAVTMLGKYYSGLLLLSLGAATVVTTQGRDWIISKHMPLAILAGLAALLPHLYWLYQNDFVSLTYIQDKHEDRGDPIRSTISFALIPLAFWLVPLLVATWASARGEKHSFRNWLTNIARAWKLNHNQLELFVIALGPYLLSLAFGIAGFVVLSSPWAIPIGFAYTLLWLSNISRSEAALSKIHRSATTLFSIWLVLILIISPIYTWQQGQSGSHNFYKPRAAAAKLLVLEWHERYPEQQLSWVAGNQWPELGIVSFYGDDQVISVEGYPDAPFAGLPAIKGWQRQPGMILCALGYIDQPRGLNCPELAREWFNQYGLPDNSFEITVSRIGWRFPVEKSFKYQAFIYLPPSQVNSESTN